MAQRSIQGNEQLAKTIKTRRNELGLTIEEAAKKAGVGTKTWCRYEAGESIRSDKYKGVCKALNWRTFPGEENDDLDIIEYRNYKTWPKDIEEKFGEIAALSFVIGSDVLLDFVNEDLHALSKMPKGTHLGQIDVSFLSEELPEQFKMMYDYDFLYALYTSIIKFQEVAKFGTEIIAKSVLEELTLYLIVEESRLLIESSEWDFDEHWDKWIFDLFGDCDIETMLYSNYYLDEDNIYHFKHWKKEQFYCD